MVNTRRSSVGLNKEVGASTSTVQSFSTTCSPQSFWKRVNKLSENQRKAIEKTGFGNLLRIPDHTLSKNLLAELMERWHPEKRAFLIAPSNDTTKINIKITHTDVAVILGLPVTGTPVILREYEPFSDLEKEYGATFEKKKITVASIEKALDSFGDAVNDKFVRLFLLFTFGKLLFPCADSKVDSRYLSIVKDLGKVHDFAWGEALLTDLTNWLCKRKEKSGQVIGGCLYFLQIWSYEHIDLARPNLLAGEELGCPTIFPRVCRWENSKSKARQWFRTMFKELDKDQVVCELQLSPQESKIDTIKAISKVDENQTRLNIMEQWFAENPQESDLVVVREVQRTDTECSDQLRSQIDTPQSTSQDNSPSVPIINDDDVEEENIASMQQKDHEEEEKKRIAQHKVDKADENIPNTQQMNEEEEIDMLYRDDKEVVNFASTLQKGDDDDNMANVQQEDDDKVENIGSTQQMNYKEENIANTQLKDNEEEENISNMQQALLKEIAELKKENNRLREENAELSYLRDENKVLKDELKEQNEIIDDLRKEKQRAQSSSEGLLTELETIIQNLISPRGSLLD